MPFLFPRITPGTEYQTLLQKARAERGVPSPYGVARMWEVKKWALQTFDLRSVFLLFLRLNTSFHPSSPLPGLSSGSPGPDPGSQPVSLECLHSGISLKQSLY